MNPIRGSSVWFSIRLNTSVLFQGLHYPCLFVLLQLDRNPRRWQYYGCFRSGCKGRETPFLKQKPFPAGHRKNVFNSLKEFDLNPNNTHTWQRKERRFICCTCPRNRLKTKRRDFRSLANIFILFALVAVCVSIYVTNPREADATLWDRCASQWVSEPELEGHPSTVVHRIQRQESQKRASSWQKLSKVWQVFKEKTKS